jgi:hypothetical protein
LRTVSRYNQLAAALVWDSTLARIAIQQVSAADAHLGLERIWTVVDAGMHHLGVPRRRSRPYQRCCLVGRRSGNEAGGRVSNEAPRAPP